MKWFVISWSQQLGENAVHCCLLARLCSMTSLTSYSPSYRDTSSGFKTGAVIPSAIFTRFDTQRFSPLLALKDALRDVISDRLVHQPKLLLLLSYWKRWRKSVECCGGYIENNCNCAVYVFVIYYFIKFLRFSLKWLLYGQICVFYGEIFRFPSIPSHWHSIAILLLFLV